MGGGSLNDEPPFTMDIILNMKLTPLELDFLTIASGALKETFPPAPFFILSPKALKAYDQEIVKAGLPEILRENDLMEEVAASTGMDRGKVAFLLSEAMEFIVWERAWIRRLQWVLQYVAIFVILNVIWLLI